MQDLFYDLSELSEEQLKGFFSDVIKFSYNTHIEKLESWTREANQDYSIGEIIESINRKEKSTCVWRTLGRYGEICYSTIFKTPHIFLYSFLSESKFIEFVDKWKLSPILKI